MKAFGCVFSLIVLGAGCGQVKEKEVTLEMLPEGETNAVYSSKAATSEEEEVETDTDTTVTLTPLQTVLSDIDAKRTDTTCYTATSTNGSGCNFATQTQVVNAIVMAVKPCTAKTATDGSKRCAGGSATQPQIDAAGGGVDWAFVQELNGGGMLLNPFGWTTLSTPALAIGDKISFKVSKMKFFYSRGYVLRIDETTLTVGKATVAELFKAAEQTLDLGSLDLSSRKAENQYRMTSGYVKVLSAATTIGTDSSYFSLATEKSTSGTELYLRAASSSAVKKDSCYHVKNVALIWNSTPTPHTYLIDTRSFDFTNASYGLGSITEVDCTVAGL